MTKKLNNNAIRDIKHAKSGYEFCDKMFEHANWLSSLANFKMKFVPIGSYHIIMHMSLCMYLQVNFKSLIFYIKKLYCYT